jgi:hypothetical protein
MTGPVGIDPRSALPAGTGTFEKHNVLAGYSLLIALVHCHLCANSVHGSSILLFSRSVTIREDRNLETRPRPRSSVSWYG